MTDPKHPLEDDLTPKDYDEYGDVPDSADNADEDKPDVPDSLAKAPWLTASRCKGFPRQARPGMLAARARSRGRDRAGG